MDRIVQATLMWAIASAFILRAGTWAEVGTLRPRGRPQRRLGTALAARTRGRGRGLSRRCQPADLHACGSEVQNRKLGLSAYLIDAQVRHHLTNRPALNLLAAIPVLALGQPHEDLAVVGDPEVMLLLGGLVAWRAVVKHRQDVTSRNEPRRGHSGAGTYAAIAGVCSSALSV
jgi:hypothetical protein